MINDLLDLLNYDNIYLIANYGVMPFWLLLIILPNHGLTNFFVQSIIAPLLLAGAYGFVAYNIFLDENNYHNSLSPIVILEMKFIDNKFF